MDEIEVRFGYTPGDIARLAGVAVYRDVWHQSLPRDERLDIAWSAIAEHLYACEERPEPGELIRAAWRDLRSEAEANWHTHGVSRTASVFSGEQTMPSFARYWFTRNTQGPEEAIVERIAVGQIWDALPEKYRRLIAALAATDDYGKAASELGKVRQTYVSQLASARRAFRELWHEGETPSRHWGTDRRGNPDAAHNKTHPNRSAARDAMRQRKRRRDAQNPGRRNIGGSQIDLSELGETDDDRQKRHTPLQGSQWPGLSGMMPEEISGQGLSTFMKQTPGPVTGLKDFRQ